MSGYRTEVDLSEVAEREEGQNYYDCPNCEERGELHETNKYCSNCGVRLEWVGESPKREDSIEYQNEQLEKDNEHLRTLLKTTMKAIPKYTTFYKTLERAVKE